jgi:hypothetical protein
MTPFNFNAAEKMILFAENCEKARETREIPSDSVYGDHWESLGEDYWLFSPPATENSGVAGPSQGDPERTFVKFWDQNACPICNGWADECYCDIDEIKEELGI